MCSGTSLNPTPGISSQARKTFKERCSYDSTGSSIGKIKTKEQTEQNQNANPLGNMFHKIYKMVIKNLLELKGMILCTPAKKRRVLKCIANKGTHWDKQKSRTYTAVHLYLQ